MAKKTTLDQEEIFFRSDETRRELYDMLYKAKQKNPLKHTQANMQPYFDLINELENIEVCSDSIDNDQKWRICRAYLFKLIKWCSFGKEDEEILYMAYGYLDGYERLTIGERRRKYKNIVSKDLLDSSVDGIYGQYENSLIRRIVWRIFHLMEDGKWAGIQFDINSETDLETPSVETKYYPSSSLAGLGRKEKKQDIDADDRSSAEDNNVTNGSEDTDVIMSDLTAIPLENKKDTKDRKRHIAVISAVAIIIAIICLCLVLSLKKEKTDDIASTSEIGTLLSIEDVQQLINDNPVFGYMVAKGVIDYVANPSTDTPKTIGELNPELLEFIRITDEAFALPVDAERHGFATWYSEPDNPNSKPILEYQNYARILRSLLNNFQVSYEKRTSQRNWIIQNNDNPSQASVIENEKQVQSNWLTLSYAVMNGEKTVIFGFSTYDMRFAYLGDSSTPVHLDDLQIDY